MFLLGISPAKVRFFSDATPSVRAKPRRARTRCVLSLVPPATTGWLTGNAVALTVRNTKDTGAHLALPANSSLAPAHPAQTQTHANILMCECSITLLKKRKVFHLLVRGRKSFFFAFATAVLGDVMMTFPVFYIFA